MACQKDCHKSLDVACTQDQSNFYFMPECSATLHQCSRKIMGGPGTDEYEVLIEQETSLRRELSKLRADYLQKQCENHRRKEALESQHEQVCEQLRVALDAQSFLGPMTLGSSHPVMDKVQELARTESQTRQDIILLKEEFVKEQDYRQLEITTMECVHENIRAKLAERLLKRMPTCSSTASSAGVESHEEPELRPTSTIEHVRDHVRSALEENLNDLQDLQVLNHLPAVSAQGRPAPDAVPPSEFSYKAQQVRAEVGEVMRRVQERMDKIKQKRETSADEMATIGNREYQYQ